MTGSWKKVLSKSHSESPTIRPIPTWEELQDKPWSQTLGGDPWGICHCSPAFQNSNLHLEASKLRSPQDFFSQIHRLNSSWQMLEFSCQFFCMLQKSRMDVPNCKQSQQCRTCELLLRLMSIWSLNKWCECLLRAQPSRIKIMHEAIPVVRPVTVSCRAPDRFTKLWVVHGYAAYAQMNLKSLQRPFKKNPIAAHNILDSFRLLNEGSSWLFNVGILDGCFPCSSGAMVNSMRQYMREMTPAKQR